jgi:hypothetical protein
MAQRVVAVRGIRVSGQEFPAVTFPPSLNAGSSCDSFSSVELGRGPSSLANLGSVGQTHGNDLAVELNEASPRR